MRPYGWAGLLLLLVSSIQAFRGVEPFHTWFYCFAWWSYILLADNLVLIRRGRSLLAGRRGEFPLMLLLSVFIWLLFEAYNLVIRNWAYTGVPAEIWLRWPGYAIAFATVLPGIFTTSDLIESFFRGRRNEGFASEPEPVAAGSRRLPAWPFLAAGAVLSAAPLVWPRYFFPAVWLGPVLLLDPLLERVGVRSLAAAFASGSRRRLWSLMLGGFACGLLWEFWNAGASSRWIYTVPFFDSWKLFEMPAPGYLGFAPFALECWILYHLLKSSMARAGGALARAALCLAMAAFCLLLFAAIDARTVRHFAQAIAW